MGFIDVNLIVIDDDWIAADPAGSGTGNKSTYSDTREWTSIWSAQP